MTRMQHSKFRRAAGSLARCCILVFLVIGTSKVGSAQQSQVQQGLLEQGQMLTTPGSSDVEMALQRLIQSTESARKSILTDSSSMKVPVLPPLSRSQTAGPATSPTDVSQIRERIKLLKRLRKEQQPRSQPSVNQLRPLPVPRNAEPAESTPSSDPVEPTLPAIEKNITAETMPAEDTEAAAPVISATQVMTSPVDSMKLGESLYRTKNYTAALKAFKSVDLKGMPKSDQAWCDLMKALCQLRMGDIDKAQEALRTLANSTDPDFSVTAARWWLKQTKINSETRPMLSTMSTEINALLERANQHVGY